MLNLYLSEISVGAYGFDAMTDAHDELPFFAHRIDKLHGNETGIIRFRELSRRAVQRSTKPVSLQITTIIRNKHFGPNSFQAAFTTKKRRQKARQLDNLKKCS